MRGSARRTTGLTLIEMTLVVATIALLVGFAVPAAGMGYQDRIGLIFAYDPFRERIVGISVLDSRETPGLGDRIGYDKTYMANFAALPVELDASGYLAHDLVPVKPGAKTQTWHIDTISGATVSSRAAVDIVNHGAHRWLAALRRYANEEQHEPKTR